tara:strand:+ start:1856 stop:2095 length:240 start_codon:yes stop_codon:yes gene_type:complete
MSKTSEVGREARSMARALEGFSMIGDLPYWVVEDLARLAIKAHSLADRIAESEAKYGRAVPSEVDSQPNHSNTNTEKED